jgi:F5/8 type C domain/Glycosyl hydrolase family 79 C-terminal beta domain
VFRALVRTTRRRPHLALVAGAAAALVAAQLGAAAVASAADPLISQGRPVLASSVSGTFAAANAVDGKTTTRWASATSADPQWIRIDLGRKMSLSKVTLSWDKACATSFKVQVSDNGTSFTTVYSTQTGKGGSETHTVSGAGRYVRMNATVRCLSTSGYSLQEFQVFGAPFVTSSPSRSPSPSPSPSRTPDPLVSQGRPAAASSTNGATSVAGNAVDGDTRTSWTSVSGVDPQWLRVDLGVRYNVSKVTIVWGAACAKAYQIQVSDDGQTFTNVFLATASAGGTENLPIQATGRYVRMFGTARCGTAGYSVTEFKVYGSVAPVPKWISKGRPVLSSGDLDAAHPATNAVDGSTTTAWQSNVSTPDVPMPQWIRVDLGVDFQLTKVQIIWADPLCSTSYRLQVSDNDVDYSDEFQNLSGAGGTETIYLNAVGRYVRLWDSISCGTNTSIAVNEFKVYGVPPTPVPAVGSITIGNQNGSFLAESYGGFSFGIEQLGRDINAGNFTQYLKTLGTGVMRWGGSTDENLWWTSTNEPMPTWAEFTLTPALLQKLNTLAVNSGWKVILGVNLKRGDAARAADEAKFAKQILGSRLVGLEMGNEPNYWVGYSPAQYYQDWETFRTAIQAVAPGVALLGPSVGRVAAGDVFLKDFTSRQLGHVDVAVLASHFYPSCSRSASNGKISIPTLLSVDWHNRERLRADLVASLAAQMQVPGMITETNSVSCTGLAGVSDVYAAALWGVDEMMSVAEAGDQGINFHGDLGTCDSPFYSPMCALTRADDDAMKLVARPVYYAQLVTQQVGTGFMQPVSNDATQVVRAYAVRNGTRLRLVLVNVSDPAGTAAYPVKINLGSTFTHGDFFRLTAPSLDATTGITLGGRAVTANGTYAGPTHTPLTVNGKTLSLNLPAGTATVITLTP